MAGVPLLSVFNWGNAAPPLPLVPEAEVVNPLADQLARGLVKTLAYPGQVYNSTQPVTTGQMIAPAADLASLVTLGAGAAPAEADALRMGMSFPSRAEQFAEKEGSLGQNYRSSIDAQSALTSPEALDKPIPTNRELSSAEFINALRDRLSAEGWHTYSPPNPNSLSRYLQVGNKSEFHQGVDPVGAVRIRASDHGGYGADFDFRPNQNGKYDQDLNSITAQILSELGKINPP